LGKAAKTNSIEETSHMRPSEMTKLYDDLSAPVLTTSADHYEKAAEHCERAAKEYFRASGHYDYGDFEQSLEHAKLGSHHLQEAKRHCSLAVK
jgi:hypothetical protein